MCWIKLFITFQILKGSRVKIMEERWINLAESVLIAPPTTEFNQAIIQISGELAFEVDVETTRKLMRAVEINARMIEQVFNANERPPRMRDIATLPKDKQAAKAERPYED